MTLTSLSVQSTTLDDVFAHYTGHQLRDTLQRSGGLQQRVYVRKQERMNRIWAIIERDLRRFRRSPTLVIVSMVMPLVQLVVLGYAFGGKVKHLKVGVLDQDHGMPAIKMHEMAQAVAANAQTFETHLLQRSGDGFARFARWQNQRLAEHPAGISRAKYWPGTNPKIALMEDNTDQFAASALEGSLDQMLAAYNQPPVPGSRLGADATLSVVEVYPYVPYIQYLVAGDHRAGDFCLGHDRRRHYFY